MSRFILVPGSGGVAWYWSRVVPLLEAAGHDAVAVDLPGDDQTAGLAEYAELVVRAADGHGDVVLVAGSLGGFTAAIASRDLSLRALVFVNAMIPVPGEMAGKWWDDVDAIPAREQAAGSGGYSCEFDLETYFLHDVPAAVAAEGEAYQREEAELVFGQACDFDRWPSVPTHVLAGADDRFFPVALQRRVASDRLGLSIDVIPGGHLIALANPAGVAEYLLRIS
jgi:pimeloyl-ACP methyl ester carboxylesterase